MVPKFPAEWFFTLEYWQRQNSSELTGGVWFEWQLHLPTAEQWEGGCAMKWLGQQLAEHGRRIFILGWSGCLEKSWSANDEGCEDLKRLWSAGNKGWKVMDSEGDSPSGKTSCPNRGCVLLMRSACHHSEQMCLFLLARSLFPSVCHSWGALPGTALIGGVLSVLGSPPSLPAASAVSPSALRAELKGMPALALQHLTGEQQAWCMVNLGLLLNLPVQLNVGVVPTLQLVCPVEMRSSGRRGTWSEGVGACSWQALCRAAFHVFISLVYLWHWWFPWPWVFAVKGKFESLPSFIYNYK